MTGPFRVNAPGLIDGANGFTDEAETVAQLASQFEHLSDPGGLLPAAGNDPNGKSFIKTFQETASPLAQQVRSWANATAATGTSILQMAKQFIESDESAGDKAKQFGALLEQLNGIDAGFFEPADAQPGSPTSPTDTGTGHHHP